MIYVSDQFNFLHNRAMGIKLMDHDQWVVQVKEWLQKIDDGQMTTDDVRRSILEYQKQCELNEDIAKELLASAESSMGAGC